MQKISPVSTIALFLLVMVLPSVATASNVEGLYYFMGLQALSILWPFLLPLFYLRAAGKKLFLYLLLLMVPLGLLELMDIPWAVYYSLAGWGLLGEDIQPAPVYYLISRHLIALGASFWLLSRVRRIWNRLDQENQSTP